MKVSLNSLLSPSSVAVIGATDNLSKFGGRAFLNLVNSGYRGRIIPVSRVRDTLCGIKCFPSIMDVGSEIDVAVLVVPAGAVNDIVQQSVDAGVKTAIIITSGFAEIGPEGKARQDQLVRIADTSGMRILGPNCLGLAVPGRSLVLSSSVVFTRESALRAGGIALISQSGALMTQMYAVGLDAGAGFSGCVSVGNQADLELSEFINYFVDDSDTKAIACYVEQLKSPSKFVEALAKGNASGKPILLTKAGRTTAGAAVAQSHTGSIVGQFSAFEATCRRYGAVLFDQAEDMIRAADVLDRCGRAPGTRYAVVSGSGGAAALAMDVLARSPFNAAQLTEESRERLRTYYAEPQRKLPLDIGANLGGFSPTNSLQAAETVLSDQNVDCAILLMTPQPVIKETADAFIATSRKMEKPTLIVASSKLVLDEVKSASVRHNYPALPDLRSAICSLSTFAPAQSVPGSPEPLRLAEIAVPQVDGNLTEPEATKLLMAAGVTTARARFASNKEDAIRAAGEIGYPVVLKAVTRSLVRKSDVGGVRIGIVDAEGVGLAWDQISYSLAQHGFHDAEGCIVAEMVFGVVEMIVGAKYDKEFGPMIMIGIGGTLVELFEDIVIAPAPILAKEAEEMMRRLKFWPLLMGARGRPIADVAAVTHAAQQVSVLAVTLGDRLQSLDVNPLIVRPKGNGAIAVDARISLSSHFAEGPSRDQ
jgi:acyl-CoA synthetase (NDP forming)